MLISTNIAQTVVAPPEAELDKYPILNGALSQQQIKELGLSKKNLLNPWTGYNWSRRINKFLYETLPVGTAVLVDDNDTPRYKLDCVNRLVGVSSKTEARDYCKNYPSYFVFVDNSTTNNYNDNSVVINYYQAELWTSIRPYVIWTGILTGVAILIKVIFFSHNHNEENQKSLSSGDILLPN